MMRAALTAILLLLAAPAFADEGMWTFDNFPSAAVKAKYGVTIDKAWLDHVRGAAIRLSDGCSASVVSADGLVMTNHHCVAGCAQNLSDAQHDYVKSGFFTDAREEEKQCPGIQAEILESITDVTAKVNAATVGKAGDVFVRARDGAIAGIEKSACQDHEATHRCQVISLYEGGQYKLYSYRKYSDVRLVFAPEFETAFFGGDPDNFNFPRYDLDVSFLRLYVDGAPASTPDHLAWNPAPPKPGDPVFVVGNPGRTERLLAADELLVLRDLRWPALIDMGEIRGRYTEFAEESAEHARIVNRNLFGIENALKNLRGQQQALMDPDLIATKDKSDAELKAKVAADPKLAAEIGDPWSDIARADTAQRELYVSDSMLESRAGGGSRLFNYARTIVRGAEERAKPNAERLREYTDARLPLLEKRLFDRAVVEPDLERLNLVFWLTKLREELTVDAPETKLFLGTDSPQSLAGALTQSGLADPSLRKRLWEGGLDAVKASDDPMIRYVLKTDGASRAIRLDYETRVEGPIDRASEKIARARFAVYGTSVYPDATFSLRLSYGTIKGWQEPNRTIGPFTTFAGLYRRATGQFPFALAARWKDAQSKLDPDTVFDMSSDNDIIGGNSGSPLIDARGRAIGAIFDGNIHSLGGNFYFDPKLNRAVSVSTAAITEALDKIYGRKALLAELMAP
jgi:Peptidase S46